MIKISFDKNSQILQKNSLFETVIVSANDELVRCF